MGECICNSCRNLKSVIGSAGEVGEYTCEYGYPSDNCEECTGEDCQEECSHYVLDDESAVPQTVKCMKCGKELKKVFNDNDSGEVYCIDCYLNM